MSYFNALKFTQNKLLYEAIFYRIKLLYKSKWIVGKIWIFFILTYFPCQDDVSLKLFVNRQSCLSWPIDKCVQKSNLIQSKSVQNNRLVCFYLKPTAFCQFIVQKR